MGVRLAVAVWGAEDIKAVHVVRTRLGLPRQRLMLVMVMLERRVEVDWRGGAGRRSGPGVGGGRRVGRAHLLGRGMR